MKICADDYRALLKKAEEERLFDSCLLQVYTENDAIRYICNLVSEDALAHADTPDDVFRFEFFTGRYSKDPLFLDYRPIVTWEAFKSSLEPEEKCSKD